MKLHAAVAKILIDHGVDTMFGLIGDANMQILADFVSEHNGRYIGVANEGGAMAMAHGYASVSGRMGVVSLTHGPALTNTITALVDAVRRRSQVLVMTGETAWQRAQLQEIDIRAVAKLTGAGYERVYNARDVATATDYAMRRVSGERRPVILDVPLDLLNAEVPEDLPRTGRIERGDVAVVDAEALENALGLIASANRPVILAGLGAVRSGAREALVELGELIGAPLATTVLAKDFFRGEPFDLGVCGTVASSVAIGAISQADCIVAFGASLNQFTSGSLVVADPNSLFGGKRIVQCEIEPSRIGSVIPVTVGVVGDATAVARGMVTALREAGISKQGGRTPELKKALETYAPLAEFSDASTDETVDQRTAMVRLDEIMPRERVLVTDAGRFLGSAWRFVHVADPKCFVSSVQYGSIGLGLGTAIGAAVARPDLVTLAVLGDGGAMMNIGEFTTAVRNRLRLVVVVVNDSAYGSFYYKLADVGAHPSHSFSDWPSLADLAVAMGGQGITVRSAKELDQLIELLPKLDGPLLVDLKVDPVVDVRR